MGESERYLAMVKEIVLKWLDPNDYAVFLFGSRAGPLHGKMTDVDVGVLGHQELPQHLKVAIEEEIAESLVPYEVDIVDFYIADETFKKIALDKIVLWNQPTSIKIK